MKIHYLQHVPFEDLAYIELWSKQKGCMVTKTSFNDPYLFPELSEFDLLVILGGPMNIYEYEKYPWLKEEKEFIRKVIMAEKKVIGICLGAQLIAHVLGARIFQNTYKEIGWFPVKLNNDEFMPPVFENFPAEFMAFHWHGDTFDLPPGARRIASSEACLNQAFIHNDKVIGLQFHLEYTRNSILQMLQHCSDELVDAAYIQKKEHILLQMDNIEQLNTHMQSLLEKLIAIF